MFRGPGSDLSMWRGHTAQCDSGLGEFWVFSGPGNDFFMLRSLLAQCDSGLGGVLGV